MQDLALGVSNNPDDGAGAPGVTVSAPASNDFDNFGARPTGGEAEEAEDEDDAEDDDGTEDADEEVQGGDAESKQSGKRSGGGGNPGTSALIQEI